MSDNEQEPTSVGAGLPEDAPPGMGMDPAEHSENDIEGDDAPQTSRAQDGDPGQATGNTHAAGAQPGSADGDD